MTLCVVSLDRLHAACAPPLIPFLNFMILHLSGAIFSARTCVSEGGSRLIIQRVSIYHTHKTKVCKRVVSKRVVLQRAPNPPEFVQPHIGTNTPKFVPLRWGRLPFDPTQTGLCNSRVFGAR